MFLSLLSLCLQASLTHTEPPPIVVAVVGPPKVGKSTVLSRTSPGRHSPTFRLVDIVVYEISVNVLKNNLSISLIKAKLDIIFI